VLFSINCSNIERFIDLEIFVSFASLITPYSQIKSFTSVWDERMGEVPPCKDATPEFCPKTTAYYCSATCKNYRFLPMKPILQLV
jgi:hypothetical protein